MSSLSKSNLLCLFGLVLCCRCADEPFAWNYQWGTEYGPFSWGDGFDTCNGEEQSPINIHQSAVDGFESFKTELSATNVGISVSSGNTLLDAWRWENDEYISHFEASNNGHSIVFIPMDGEGNFLNTEESGYMARLPNIFGSSDTAAEFCLHSFHFHWGEYDTQGSEHTLYGVSYPAEIHFVHYSCNYSDLNAAIAAATTLDDQRVLAVVGFLFEVDDEAEASETPLMTDIVERIEELQYVGETALMPNVNLLGNIVPNYVHDSLDRTESNFWHYKGSLTTPPCHEYVQWHVMDYKPKITTTQLEYLRALSTVAESVNNSDSESVEMRQNWRPVQDNVNTLYKFEFTNGDTSGSDSDSDSDSDEGNWSKLYEKDEDIIDFSIAILIILIVFCLVWIVYIINQKSSSKAQTGKGNESTASEIVAFKSGGGASGKV